MMARLILVMILCLSLAACTPPPEPPPVAIEPGRGSMGYYCGMALTEHVGPKGQIHVAEAQDPLWFSSVRDTFVYLQTESTTRRIRAVYVNDMGQSDWNHPQPGSWVEVQKALFVTGSRQKGSMGEVEIVPFRERLLAENFAQQHGGQVVSYSEVVKNELSDKFWW